MFPKSSFIISALILLILLTILFNLGDTSTEVTKLTLVQNQTAAVSDFDGNLILHYTFDDGTTTDSSGHGNNGTLQGATAVVSGKIGQAMQFNPKNSSMLCIGPYGSLYGWTTYEKDTMSHSSYTT